MLDFGLKTWILLGGAAVIIAVLAHGLWLARQRSRSALRMDIERSTGRDDVDITLSELPGGGRVRVTRLGAAVDHPEVEPDWHEADTPPPAEPAPPPAQQRLPNLDDPVPVLLEAVDEPRSAQRRDGARAPAGTGATGSGATGSGATGSRATGPDATNAIRAEERATRPAAGKREQPAAPRSGGAPLERQPEPPDEMTEDEQPNPDEIITFAVLARDRAGFPGGEVLRYVTDRGLAYGEMNIFHYLIGERTQYSMANMVEPGTFDLAAIEDSRLRGLAFFLRLPGPDRPLEALDHMIGVVRGLAARFDGDLVDGERSVLTRQGIEHARDLVRTYTRRRLPRRA